MPAPRSPRPFERIEVLVGERIPGDRVDGEVAAPRRFVDRQCRIARDLEAAVAAAVLRFAARQRDVDAGNLVDGEALADGVDRAELRQQLAQCRRGEAVDLEIDVLRRAPDQPIANPAADDQRAAAGVLRHAARCAIDDREAGVSTTLSEPHHGPQRVAGRTSAPACRQARRDRIEDGQRRARAHAGTPRGAAAGCTRRPPARPRRPTASGRAPTPSGRSPAPSPGGTPSRSIPGRRR